jgi:hypothetical protein
MSWTSVHQKASVIVEQDTGKVLKLRQPGTWMWLSMTRALETKGFAVTEAGVTAPVDLKIELRLLEYSTSVGFWTGGVHVNGAMKAVATNNGDVYERMYRSDDEERVVFVPDASSNEKMINESLSFLLNQVIGDNALIGHLAK